MKKKRIILFMLLCIMLPMKMAAQDWDTVDQDRIVEESKQPESVNVYGTVVTKDDDRAINGANVNVVGTQLSTTTDFLGKFSITLPTGKNVLRISHTDMKTVEMTASNNMRIQMVRKDTESDGFFSSTCFYLQPTLQAGALMGVGVAVGAYISNFNVEAFFTMGLAKSEDITWYPPSGSNKANVTCSYKPTAFGLHVGYGFVVAEKLRLTPQVGLSAVSIKCSDGDSKGNVASAAIGVKGEYALSRNIAIFAAPEVAFAVTRSDVYKQLEDVSSKIKGWGTGFNARLGVTVTF